MIAPRDGGRCGGTEGPTHRRVALHGYVFVLLAATIALASGCATLAPGRSSSNEGTDGAEGTERADEDTPVFQTSEDYWVQTPWFSVSSVVIRVRTTQPRTVIVLPESSIMRDYMMNDRNVVFNADAVPHRMRFLLGLGLKTGDTDPFFDSDLIEHGQRYE